MCGIAGFFSQKNKMGIEILHAMTTALSRRGPDDAGHYFESQGNLTVALGHRRLSIIDRSSLASQPMQFKHLVITYNGEVYNFAEIKQELYAAGYTFISQSDTEVVLKAFHKWGMQSVNKFRGMFALCIVDKKNQKAYLIRDRSGVKPLYYYCKDSDFIFASEIKSLHCHPRFIKKLNQQGLELFLQHGYISAPYSIFGDLKKVQAGHFLEINLINNSISENKYWDLSSFYQMPKFCDDEQSITKQLHATLVDSFSLRMIADVPVGVLLSGGIDSSLVAAILQAQAKKPIETFTISFHQQDYDESSYAKEIANYLGTQHHEHRCTWQETESIISILPKIYDEPFADSSAIPTAMVSKFAKESVSVVLSGDGGDEMFCGYSAYNLFARRFNLLDKVRGKRFLNKLLSCIPDPIMGMYKINFDLYDRYLKFRSILLQDSIEDKYRYANRIFTTYDISQLMLNSANSQIVESVLNHLSSQEKMMFMDFKYYLPDDLLVKVDRATMYYSLEGREPLLDHKILEFAAQIPMELKAGKKILKNILAQYIPTSYFERKKHGFGVPVNVWLRSELRFLIDQYLNTEKIIKQGIFNHKFISRLCQAFLSNNTNDNRIWTLLVFQKWYEEYFGKTQ